MFSQVGIVALNLLGTDEEFSPGKVSGSGMSSSSHHSNQNQNQNRPIFNNPLNDLSVDMNLDPPTAEKLRLLSDAKVSE